MRKIAGAFRTTPVAALEAELGLLPADIRLEYKQQSYVARLLTLPDNHPVLQLCPNTFPKTLDREQAEETPANLTPWHMQNPLKPRYESRLTKALSSVNVIIQPQTNVETIDDNAAPPWNTKKVFDIHIPTGMKTETAEQHKKHHRSTLQDKKHLCKRQPHPQNSFLKITPQPTNLSSF
jgi:hypothetical protein